MTYPDVLVVKTDNKIGWRGGGGERGATTILVPVREESYDGVYLGCMNTSDEENDCFPSVEFSF